MNITVYVFTFIFTALYVLSKTIYYLPLPLRSENIITDLVPSYLTFEVLSSQNT
jgi:hypothetical protein